MSCLTHTSALCQPDKDKLLAAQKRKHTQHACVACHSMASCCSQKKGTGQPYNAPQSYLNTILHGKWRGGGHTVKPQGNNANRSNAAGPFTLHANLPALQAHVHCGGSHPPKVDPPLAVSVGLSLPKNPYAANTLFPTSLRLPHTGRATGGAQRGHSYLPCPVVRVTSNNTGL